jgi:hypothetical protein
MWMDLDLRMAQVKALPFLGADSLYFRDGTAACAYYIAAACT